MGYEKFIMDADQAGMLAVMLQGVDMSENGQAMDAFREIGPGGVTFWCQSHSSKFEQHFIVPRLPIIIALNNGSRKEVLTAQNVLI